MGRLEVEHLAVRFGPIEAVRDVSFALAPGKALALVGPNGAGKSTVLAAIANALPRNAVADLHSTLRWDPVRADSPWQGRPALVPESGKVFTVMTVEENLEVSARYAPGSHFDLAAAYRWFPRLKARQGTLAGNLSGGEQQMLAIASALLSHPRVLMLDEPTLGLSVPVIEALCEDLKRLRQELGLTVLLSEASSTWIPKLADEAVLMDRGLTLGEPFDLGRTSAQDIEHALMRATGLDLREPHGEASHAD